MAVCETKKKRIRYCEGVQAKATKIVAAPPDINGWYPVFVTTRRKINGLLFGKHSATTLKKIESLMPGFISIMKIFAKRDYDSRLHAVGLKHFLFEKAIVIKLR